MPDLNPKPHRFKAGPALSAGELNKLRDAIPRLITGGAGISVSKLGDRLVVSLDRKVEEVPGTSHLVTIVSIHDNYLVCNKDGAEVAVAKPWALRKGVQFPSGPNYTYSSAGVRTATAAGEDPETQRITPDYEVDEELLVRRLASARVEDADGGLLLYYVDENNLGRCWAKVQDD